MNVVPNGAGLSVQIDQGKSYPESSTTNAQQATVIATAPAVVTPTTATPATVFYTIGPNLNYSPPVQVAPGGVNTADPVGGVVTPAFTATAPTTAATLTSSAGPVIYQEPALSFVANWYE